MSSEPLHVFGRELALGAHLEELELNVEMMRFLNENRLRLDSRIRVVRINGPSQAGAVGPRLLTPAWYDQPYSVISLMSTSV